MSSVNSTPTPLHSGRSGDISAEAVAVQLSRVTGSRTFENAPVLRHLLDQLVTRAISGNGKTDQLREYALGIEVFGRGASFDPSVDTIVRVQARRLRAKLAEYYVGEGRQDAVVIELPKGHYVPTFHTNGASVVAPNQDAAGIRLPSRWWLALAPVLLIGAGLLFLLRDRLESSPGRPESEVTGVAATAAAAVPRPKPLSVVVTPFENHTGEASFDAVGHRVAEQAIAAIAGLEGAAVAARPAAQPDDDDAPADVLVAGTYYRDAGRLEFQTRLVDARTGRLLHGFTTAATPITEVATALESVRQRIAGAIAVHQDEFFGGLDVISHPPTLDAYREYRAGLEIFQSDYARTLSHLHRSRELAPRFVPALVVMVFAYENLGQRDDSDLVIAELERTSDRLTSAERMLIEFVQSNRLGRREQARRVLEELARRTPASLLVNFNLVQCNVLVNRPQAAVIAYMRQPSISKALRHSVESYRRIRFLDALHMLGAYQRELAESRSAQADAPGVLPFVLAEARALIGLGRGAELREIVERSQSLPRTAGWGQSPGGLMEQIAHELSAHGSRAESLAMAADAVQWYRSRPAQPGAQQQYRESLARALHLAERFHEAGALFEELASAFPADLGYRVRLALIAAQTGDAQRARLLSTGLERATGPADRGRTSYDRARIAAALGERERALQLLRDAFNEGLEHGPSRHHSADFASLREYQPYQRLLRPAG